MKSTNLPFDSCAKLKFDTLKIVESSFNAAFAMHTCIDVISCTTPSRELSLIDVVCIGMMYSVQ